MEFDSSKIKTGDILLSYSPFNLWNIIKPINPLKVADNLLGQIVSAEIRACTQSPFSHIGLLVKKADDKIMIIEAIAKGLVINNFEKYLDENRYRITIIRIMKTLNPLTQNQVQGIQGQGIQDRGVMDNQCLSPNSLNNTPCPLPNPLPQGGREGWECCETNLSPQSRATLVPQKSKINLAPQRCEALTDEMRAKMKETAFNMINSSKNYYDKKLLILIALAIRLWGKNGYENGMNYLRCHYDNFWICSEWVQYLYAQVGIQFTDTNRLLAPEDFNRYENKEIIFSNL